MVGFNFEAKLLCWWLAVAWADTAQYQIPRGESDFNDGDDESDDAAYFLFVLFFLPLPPSLPLTPLYLTYLGGDHDPLRGSDALAVHCSHLVWAKTSIISRRRRRLRLIPRSNEVVTHKCREFERRSSLLCLSGRFVRLNCVYE